MQGVTDDLVAVARLAKPRGLKGELIGDILTDFPERFDALDEVTLVMPDGSRRELAIDDHWFQSGRIVLRFGGVDTVEKAEELRNAEVCVTEADAVELESDEFYDWQLEGCRVETTEHTLIGTVRELLRTGGTEILIVNGEKDYMIPFAESICVEVDIENKLIVVDLPEGLLDF